MLRRTCVALLFFSPVAALRHEAAHFVDGGAELQENCPDMCRSFNFVFMKTSGKSPTELQKEVNKKCKYSFCQGCAGGGGRDGVPCCTPNCEVVEEEKAVAVEAKAAAAIANKAVEDPCDAFLNQPAGDSKLELSSLRSKFDPWGHHTDPFSGMPMWDSPAPVPVFEPAPAPSFYTPAPSPSYITFHPAPSFNFPSFTPPPSYAFNPISRSYNDPFSVWYVPGEDEDPPQDDGTAVYTPAQGEECEFLQGALWCPGVSYSPGSQYHKGFMHPLCCTKEEPKASTTAATTLQYGGYEPKLNEVCEYVSGIWCPSDSYNPGYKYYRSMLEPLCCHEDEGSSVDGPPKKPEDVVGYKPKKNEVCFFEPSAPIKGYPFCPKPSYNVGRKYENDEGMPLCCKEGITSTEAPGPDTPATPISTTTAPRPATPAAPITTAPSEDEGSSVDKPMGKPLPEATVKDLMGYKAIKGEKCWHEPAASIRGRKFCPIPSYNVGRKYENEKGHPLCCQRMDHWYISGKDDDVEAIAENFLENFTHIPKSVEDVPALREPDCPSDREFALQTYRLNCVEKTLCIDKHSGKPEDKICCSKKAKEVSDAMISYNEATNVCEKQPIDSCHPLSEPDGLPSGYVCDRMFWCVNKKAGTEERVGPVATESVCQSLYLMPKETCGVAKLA